MWTKSQKISACVLGLAVAAFLVDRLVLGGSAAADDAAGEYAAARPSEPASDAVPRPATGTAAPAGVAQAPAPVAAATVSLASRLAALADSRRLGVMLAGDAFRPSDAWVAAVTPPPPPPTPKAPAASAAAPARPKVDPALNFQRTHTLTAVMTNHEGGMAIVNGKLYKTGQVVDGFKLTKVGVKDAQFWGKGKGVTLTLPGPPPVADAR